MPLISIQSSAASTPQTIQYTKTWGGNNLDAGRGIAIDASRNIYITGYTYSYGPGSPTRYAVSLLKYNSSGFLQWQRIWSGSGNGSDIGWGIAVDGAGNIYVTGSTTSFGAGGSDVLVLKFDSSGTLVWQKTWGGGGEDGGYGVAVDASGNIFVTGVTASFGAGNFDVFLLKLDSTGSLVWQNTWGGSSDDFGLGVATDLSGNVYVTGQVRSYGAGFGDLLLLKFDPSGSLLWQKTWGASKFDEGTHVAVDVSGDIYVTGDTYSFGAGGLDVLLLKFDSSGNILFQHTWGGVNLDEGLSVAVDSGGYIYITGNTQSFGAGSADVFLLKFDPPGNLLNHEIYGGSNEDVGYGVAVDSAEDAFITGAVSEAPTYGSITSGNSTLGTPTFSLGNPSFTLGTPTFLTRSLAGVAATSSGNQTYAGSEDVFLTLYGPTTYKLTIKTSTGAGSIAVNGTSYTNGQSVNLTSGIYTATASQPVGYAFTGWTRTGGITLTSITSNPTTANVTGTATLTASFTQISTPTPLTPGMILLSTLLASTALALLTRKRR